MSLILGATVFWVVSCSPIDKRGARELAKTGATAIETTGGALDGTQGGISQTVDMVELVRAVRPVDYRPVPDPIRDQVAQISRIRSLREAAMRELVETYQAFRALTKHEEASVETSRALAEAIEAINAWSAEVRAHRGERGQPLLSDTLGGMIEANDSIIERERLKAAIGIASERMRIVLEGVVTVLIEEKELIVAVQRRTAAIRAATDVALSQAGVLDPRHWFESLLAESGIPVRVGEIDRQDPNNPRLKEWAGNVRAESLEREAEQIRRTYDLAIDLVGRLIRQHQRLEIGERVDLTLIQNRIRQLADTGKPSRTSP